MKNPYFCLKIKIFRHETYTIIIQKLYSTTPLTHKPQIWCLRGNSVREALKHSKTTPRSLKIVDTKAHLAKWFNLHPHKDNPQAPLFCMLGKVGYGEKMPYACYRVMLKRLAAKAGVNPKDVHPHNFRHLAASRYASWMSHAEMCTWFGWVYGSRVAQRYIHMTGSDLDARVDEMRGIKKRKENIDTGFSAKTCSSCGWSNSNEKDLCEKCGTALGLQAAIKVDNHHIKMEKRMLVMESLLEQLLKDKQADDALLVRLCEGANRKFEIKAREAGR